MTGNLYAVGSTQNLDWGAFYQGLGVFGAEGYDCVVGKAGSNFDASEILERNRDGLTLQVVVGNQVDVRLRAVEPDGIPPGKVGNEFLGHRKTPRKQNSRSALNHHGRRRFLPGSHARCVACSD